ncbi:MAG: JAB domain-containing protein [Deltaproteobacteria bacterium]|nr:JAB domain-containing protein [Deltaproteobacteria bacterium]
MCTRDEWSSRPAARGSGFGACPTITPTGNVQPSEQDKLLTRTLVLAAEAVQLKIVDHLIVSGEDVFSFRKAGLL